MPDTGALHPIVVHFVIALLVVGVLMRLVAFIGKPKFVGPAATTLLVIGALTSVLAVKSGDDAHGPVERIPGVRAIMHEHEEWGERTRNLFLFVAALEIAGLALAKTRYNRYLLIGSAVAGLAGLFFIYETGEHGGELVYDYAGGVGTRTDDPEAVNRLLTAGLYHQAMQDREAGRTAEAARLIDELSLRHPEDLEVQILAAESLLLDRRNAPAALAKLFELDPPADDARSVIRHGLLMVDALRANGNPDAAEARLGELARQFPESGAIQRRLEGG